MEDQRNGIACMKEIGKDSSLWKRGVKGVW